MEFTIRRREASDPNKYDHEALDHAREFAKRIHKELGGFLKEVVLFGSTVKKEKHGKSNDIDILIIVDDVSMVLGEEVVQTYRIIMEKTVAQVSPQLHITTLRLSSFWEYVRSGDPIVINMLRDGIALIDTGFWDPLKMLLQQGRIRPTPESIWNYFVKAPNSLHASEGNIARAFLDLYWAVIDSAHAALMSIGEVPPTPEHVPELMQKTLVAHKRVPASCPQTVKKFYTVMKELEHRKRAVISGKEYDAYKKEAESFVAAMRSVVKKYEKK